MKYYLPSTFAQAYGQSAYGDCTYNDQVGCSTSAGGGTTGNSSGGGLANTGIAVATIVTLACLIIFVSLIVRIWRRKTAPVAVVQEVDDVSVDARTPDDRL